jgi:transmembrane sensor
VAAFNSASGRENLMLKPNQQSILNSGGAQVLNVDAEAAVDWKNGDFVFDNARLDQIMKKVARWYDIDVSYEPGIDKEQTFGGKVSRNRNISAVLKSMESTGKIKFKVEGKKVTVIR